MLSHENVLLLLLLLLLLSSSSSLSLPSSKLLGFWKVSENWHSNSERLELGQKHA